MGDARILIVDNEPQIRRVLRPRSFEISSCTTKMSSGLPWLSSGRPSMSFFPVCAILRQRLRRASDS